MSIRTGSVSSCEGLREGRSRVGTCNVEMIGRKGHSSHDPRQFQQQRGPHVVCWMRSVCTMQQTVVLCGGFRWFRRACVLRLAASVQLKRICPDCNLFIIARSPRSIRLLQAMRAEEQQALKGNIAPAGKTIRVKRQRQIPLRASLVWERGGVYAYDLGCFAASHLLL